MPISDRHLDWEGSWNARDLGGLVTADGAVVRRRALVRSESLQHLTSRGWSTLVDYGVRTLVDLRDPEQVEKERQHPPPLVSTISVPLEEGLARDPDFARWMESGWLGTPLYYETFVRRWPDRCARAVAAVATAPPGGVVVHCGMGRDRTGLIVLLILACLGVSADDIDADHALTASRLTRRPGAVAPRHENAAVEETLARAKRTRRQAILDTLQRLDVEAALQDGGLGASDLEALRERLLERVS